MKIWSKPAKQPSTPPSPHSRQRRLTALALVLALIFASFGSAVSAADEVVLGVELDPVPTPIQLYVDDDTYTLNAYAVIQGTTSRKDITAEATWTSSSSLVKVSKGVLTAVGAASGVTVTAKYKGYTSTALTVNAGYRYEELKLKTGAPAADAPASLDVLLGDDLQLEAAAIAYNSSAEETVTDSATWTSSNTAVATVSKGAVTLLAAGKATITAKYKGRSDAITLTAESPYSSIEIREDGSPSGPLALYVGDANVELTAEAMLKNGPGSEDVTGEATWTSSNANVASVDKGVVKAVGAGTAIITVKRFGMSATVNVQVRTLYEAIRIAPDKPVNTTLYGGSVELTAEVLKGTALPLDITDDAAAEWKVTNDYIAELAFTDHDQNASTARKVLLKPKSVGSTKVTVTYKGLTKELSYTVFPSIVSVDVTKDKLDVYVGDTGDLPAVTGKTAAAASLDIAKLAAWTSSDEEVLSVVDGKWKAHKTGTVTLKAEVANEPDTPSAIRSDTIVVNVHTKVLMLVPESDMISVITGKEVDLPEVTMIDEEGEEADITDKIAWKSSSANLLVKGAKMKGLYAVSTKLTGTYLNKTVTIKVTVEDEFVSFQITPDKLSLTLKTSKSIKVVGTTKKGKKVTLTSRTDWHASNPDHVTIKGGTVRGAAEGAGMLTAVIQEKTLQVPYTVTAKLTKLTTAATSFKATAGDQIPLTVSALYENGKTVDVTASAVWTTSNAKVATVDGGQVTVVAKGSATIKAAFGGKTLTVRISVK